MRFRLPLLAAIVVAFASFPIVTALADSHAQTAGFTLQALSKDDLDAIKKASGQRVGVLVTAVAPGSAAEKAGFKPGDVLFTVGGKGVDSPDAVDQALDGKTGNVELVSVRRIEGKVYALNLTLAVDDSASAPAGATSAQPTGNAAVYTDPKGRFQFAYPKDWKSQPMQGDSGFTVACARAAFSVLCIDGNGTPDQLLDGLLGQLKASIKDYSEIGREKGQVAGNPSAALEYTGVNAQGVKTHAEVFAITFPGRGYLLICAAPDADFKDAVPTFTAILGAFSLPNAKPAATGGQPAGQGQAQPAQAAPAALTHKPGKTFQHAIGFQFWYPADWQVNPLQDNMAQLVPGDAALPANTPGEYYVVLGDAIGNSGITKPDDPRLIALLDQAIPGLAQLVPNMPAQFQKVGQPQSFPMARGLGCVADWEGNAPNGTIVRTRAFACVMDGYVVGLLAMGPRDRLAARDETLRSIFGSFGFGQSQKDPGCLGIWFYESDTIVGNYSSSSARTYRFAPDGSFQTRSKFFASTGSTDQGGNLTGSTNADVAAGDRGKWAAANGRLYLFFDDGSESDYNYTVEGQGNNRAIILHFANGKVQMWTYKGRP